MAVKVHFKPGNSNNTDNEHADGMSFGLVDGHLVVSKRNNSLAQSDVVAVYSPGSWLFAELIGREPQG